MAKKKAEKGEGALSPPPHSCTELSSVHEAPPRMESDSVKVSVRVRPFNKREQGNNMTSVIATDTRKATVTMCNRNRKEMTGEGTKIFQFDHVFWSVETPDACGARPATQADVFRTIGYPLVQHAFDGFNSCLFAYGQTGSGKTYTMMGADVKTLGGEGSGVTPRICLEIFEQKASVEAEGHSRWSVELGYVEVYNERVSDLLGKRKKGAKDGGEEVHVDVREHPSRGVFLEGQRVVEVGCLDDVVRLIELGNGVRHTAATKMNERSSRSHAIIMLLLREERTMTTTSGETIRTAGKNSRMNLVDLAGSERVAQSQVEGQQFKEATHINLSLTTLGRVIDVLADMAKKGARAQYTVAPFRDSKLTFILRDSLGGNSKTFMIATVSPSALNYEETLSTLRYASRARDIVNVAQVNEDPRARRIRELEEQMADMRKAMAGGDPAYVSELKEKLTLLESEAQKRAADLQALEREREKNEIRDLMLKATEAERLELLERADALEQEVALSRAQAERMELENKRLHDLHREKEALLRAREASLEKHCAEMRRRECSIANHQEEWQVSIKEERRQHDTLLLQLREADERNFHLSNFFRDYVTDMRRCMDAILSTALLECRQGVDVAQASVDHLTAASCELQSQVTNLKEELRQAESALTDAHMKNEKLSADATAAAAQHAHQLNDVNSQLDQLRRELEAAALENGTLRTQLDETTKELDNKNASLEKALHSAHELRGQLESATAAVAHLEAQNCAYSAAVKVATDENKKLSAHLAQLQDEEQRLSESLQKQRQIAIDLAYFDERWTFPDPKDATETTSHTKSFPQTEWKLLLQKKPLELHSIFRTEAALACHVRQSHITSLHFQLGSLQATFNVQHPITISKHQIQQRLDTYPFRAMQEMYESRNNPPSGLDALRGQLEEAHQQLEEAGAEKERLQGELEEKTSEADAAKEDNEALRGQLEEAHQQLEEAGAEKERLQNSLLGEVGALSALRDVNEALQNEIGAIAAERDGLALIVAQAAEDKADFAERFSKAEEMTAMLTSGINEFRQSLCECKSALCAADEERNRLSEELACAVWAQRKLEKDKAKLQEGYVHSEGERRKLDARFEARRENLGSIVVTVPGVTSKQSVEECFKATRTALKALQKNAA